MMDEPKKAIRTETRRELEAYRKMVALPQGQTSPLLEVLTYFEMRLSMLEMKAGAAPREGSLTSFASTTGPAMKPLESSMETPAALTASQRETLEQSLREAIWDFSNSHPSISPHMESHWIDGQTLQVTCSWRIGSGENKAGDRGAVAREEG